MWARLDNRQYNRRFDSITIVNCNLLGQESRPSVKKNGRKGLAAVFATRVRKKKKRKKCIGFQFITAHFKERGTEKNTHVKYAFGLDSSLLLMVRYRWMIG